MASPSHSGRLGLKEAVIAAVRELYEEDLITPTGGNISARCPEGDHILITASQIHKGGLGPEHVLEVDAAGKLVDPASGTATERPVDPAGGGAPGAGVSATPTPPGGPPGRKVRPSIETGMHLAIYRARPDVGAVVHTHAPLATIWGLFDEPVPPLTIDCIRFVEMRTVPFAAPGSRELASATAEALARSPAALLRNHGLVTVGKDLREAVNAALALEETLKIVVGARLMRTHGLPGGEPSVIPAAAVEFLKKVLVG